MTIFRPCIDLHNGKVKQIVGSTLQDDTESLTTNFVSCEKPSFYAELYRKFRLTGGHIIMLGSTDQNKDAALEILRTWDLQ